MSEPSFEELKVLKKFREKIQDLDLSEEDLTDLQLLRWLRARDLNVSKANEMFRKSLEWRTTNNIDKILDWKPPERFEKDYPYEIPGVDKTTGQPILIWPIGLWDFKKAVTLGETESFVLYIVQIFEKIQQKMKEGSKLVGREVTQAKFLADYQHFSLRTITAVLSVLLPFARRFEENFPESADTIVLINCSQAFQIFFSIVKSLVSGRTMSKVHIQSGESSWKPVVAKLFPLDLLPEQYGGTKQSGAQANFSDYTGNEDERDSDVTSIEINPGETQEVEIKVPGTNMHLTWLVFAGKDEIGFSITRKDTGENVVACKIYKYNSSEDEIFAGSAACDLGTYVAIFDNSFGKEKKQINYTFNLTKQ